MLTPEQISAYLDGDLSETEQEHVERALQQDEKTRDQILDQQRIAHALQIVLAADAQNEQIKRSILSVVQARAIEDLKHRVLSETSAAPSDPLTSWSETFSILRRQWFSWAGATALAVLGASLVFLWTGVFRTSIDDLLRKHRETVKKEDTKKVLDLAFEALKQTNYRSAETLFQSALKLSPRDPEAHYGLAQIRVAVKEFDEAARLYRTAIKLFPPYAAAYRSLGAIYQQQRQYDEAEKAYLAALRVAPKDADAYYGLGEVHRERGEFGDAERMYRKAIELLPNSAKAYIALGVVFAEQGRFQEAETSYRKGIDLDGKNWIPFNNLGNLHRSQGDLTQAEKDFRQALERAPEASEPHNGLALIALARGNFAEAEQFARKAVALEPTSANIHNTLGEILRHRGQLSESEQSYRKALALDPELVSAYGNMGILLLMRGQPAEAEKMFRSLLSRISGAARVPALVNLAFACGAQGKIHEGEQLFRGAQSLSPKNPRVASLLASYLADHNMKLDEAFAYATQALAAEPANPDYVANLGWVQVQRGEYTSAESLLRKAIAFFGEEGAAASPWFSLGALYEKTGNLPAAIASYQTAVRLQPGHPQASAALQRIQNKP